jgi:hypothetical protein
MKAFRRRRHCGSPKSLNRALPQNTGGRLDAAEVELPALAARCLGDRRVGDIAALNAELSAWHARRNRKQKGGWQFATADSRAKLKRLY